MPQAISFPVRERWESVSGLIESPKAFSLPAFHRLLLTAGGTLTSTLYALLSSPVRIQVVRQEITASDPDTGRFLEIGDHEKGIHREVWITGDQGDKLVYASSFISLGGLNPHLHEALLSRQVSLGDLLDRMRLASLRDRMGFGTLQSEFLSPEFRVDPASELWYRHFRLNVPNQLLASIYEVFSPHLLGI
jgi:chorismate-pyruvate lyase